MLRYYITGQLVFGHGKITLIKNMTDWEVVHQRKKTKINKDNIRKNRKLFDRNYKLGDKVMLTNNNS